VRKFLRRTCLVLAATTFALLLGEALIRVLGLAPAFTSVRFGEYVVSDDPELLWELRAGAEGVNSLGLRGPPLEDPPAHLRIALLGDSVAYGLGLGGEETIAARLEAHLREAGLDAEVLNLGVAGYNTCQEARRLERLLPVIEADTVVLVFCLNDFSGSDGIPEGVMRAARQGGAGDALQLSYRIASGSALMRELMTWSHLFRLLHELLPAEQAVVQGGKARAKAPDDDTEVVLGFARIARAAKAAGAGVTVAIMPSFERTPVYKELPLHERVAALARKAGFAVLDLAGPLREALLSSNEPLTLQGDIIHPNARGADLAAQAIAIGIGGGPGK
jgi:lysophospholipase L1-like esterase